MIPTEYYGDNTRWFIATVVSAAAPVGYEGRVKIRIHGLHSESNLDVPEKDLPWAQCVLPTTEGGVSGIGRIPRLLPSALVFGFFVDGINSQTPIIIGSLPHIELPSDIQQGQPEEDVGEERPEGFFNKVSAFLNSFVTEDIRNDDTGGLTGTTLQNRQKVCIQFFLNLGYTMNQAIGIASGLTTSSRMMTGRDGIASWGDERYKNLKTFSNDYLLFTTQLQFVAYELRGLENAANIRLLNTENLEGRDGSCEVFVKYYLREKKKVFVKNTERTAKRLKDRL
jgi:hypothetical protein